LQLSIIALSCAVSDRHNLKLQNFYNQIGRKLYKVIIVLRFI